MTYNPLIHHRRSIRLKGYDYSQAGLYFITICCKDRECLFGNITDGKMTFNEAGEVANEFLKNIPVRYEKTQMHEYVVMPNHVHFVVEIMEGAINERVIHESPLCKSQKSLRDQRRQMLLSKIIGWYKMNTAKQINIMRQKPEPSGPVWQRDYYDIIIRNEEAYQRISNYIINNPVKWGNDKFHSWGDS